MRAMLLSMLSKKAYFNVLEQQKHVSCHVCITFNENSAHTINNTLIYIILYGCINTEKMTVF